MSEMFNGEIPYVKKVMHDLLFIQKFLGTFPFNLNNKIVPWRLIVVFITSVVHNCILFRWLFWHKHIIFKITTFLNIVLTNIIPITNIFWLWKKSHLLEEFYFNIDLVETYFRNFDKKWDIRFKWIYKYLSLILIAQIAVVCFCLNITFAHGYLIHIISTYISVYSIYDQIFSFHAVISCSFSSLKYITDNWELLKKNEIILSACKAVEELFNLQLVLLTLLSLLENGYTSFSILKKGSKGPWLLVYWSTFIIFIYPIIRMVISVNYIIMQARKIDKLLYKRLLANPDDVMLEFHMTSRRTVTFTAFGFYHINGNFIVSVIAAVTTYLVIVLQYAN